VVEPERAMWKDLDLASTAVPQSLRQSQSAEDPADAARAAGPSA